MVDTALPADTPTQTVCQYLFWEITPCKHLVVQDGLCIFHFPKLTTPEKAALTVDARVAVEDMENRFHQALTALLKQIEADPQADTYKFPHFEFPAMNFGKKVFKKKCDFLDSSFKQRAYFADARFEQETNFSLCKFYEGPSFTNANFQEYASFVGTEFLDTTVIGPSFGVVTFHRGVNFTGATFYGKADFNRAIFGVQSKTKPDDESTFELARFKKGASFYLTTFSTKTTFEKATFEDVVRFAPTKFEKETSYKSAKFEKKVAFLMHSFNEEVDFTAATFGEEAFFGQISFKKWVRFDGVTLAQRTHFAGKDGSFEQGGSFQRLNIPPDALVTFENVNLERASFLDSNLSQIMLREVRWYHPASAWSKWHRRRVALWDEFREMDNEQRSYDKVAENYHQLVLNYELRRDYNTAEDFHIGEMETQRKKRGAGIKAGWRRRARQWVNPYGLYWLLSNYGSSYWQAFIGLGCMLLIVSLVFLYSGFQPSKESADSAGGLIEYNIFSDAQHHAATFSQWIADYGRAILFSLSIITFQRERFYEPVGDWSRFWLFLAVLFLTAQAAMVLLAIRRRFKR